LQGLQSHSGNQVQGFYLGNDLTQRKGKSPLYAEGKAIAGSEECYLFAFNVLLWTSIGLDYQKRLLRKLRLVAASGVDGAGKYIKRRFGSLPPEDYMSQVFSNTAG
jgi:hypothetical protein